MEKRYLSLGAISLGLSGIFSIFVVFLRLPLFAKLIPNIFDLSLVVHVNLSVNFWMICIALFLWSYKPDNGFYIAKNLVYYMCASGVLLVFISGLIPDTSIIKSNYIPVADNFAFMLGISLFFFGALISAFKTFINKNQSFAIKSSAYIFAVSAFCFILAAYKIPNGSSITDFYENLFWGFGHTLQFVFCQTLIIVYFTLLEKNIKSLSCNILSIVNFLAVLPMPLLYLFFDVQDEILRQIFTYHMRIALGITPTAAIFYLIFNMQNIKSDKVAFYASIALFIYGGMLGFLIKGNNVSIPAHYHGSIVGVTIAFMGFIYKSCNILQNKISKAQLILYSGGQFMHITGLFLMGGYGALRKTAEATAGALPLYKFMFALGGILSIVSGALFVFLALKSFYLQKPHITTAKPDSFHIS